MKNELKYSLNKGINMKLLENEVFVIVHKSNPELPHTTYGPVFVEGFRFGNSGNHEIYKSKKAIENFVKEQLHTIDLAEIYSMDKYDIRHYHWMELLKNPMVHEGSRPEEFKNLEVRKYDTIAKKVLDEVVDFDIYKEAKKCSIVDALLSKYGEGVAQVCAEIYANNLTEQYPVILSAKFSKRSISNFVLLKKEIPIEKDIAIDVSLKLCKISKKELIEYNKNSFVAIGCKNQDICDLIKAGYNNREKEVVILNVSDLLNEPHIKKILEKNETKTIKIKP